MSTELRVPVGQTVYMLCPNNNHNQPQPLSHQSQQKPIHHHKRSQNLLVDSSIASDLYVDWTKDGALVEDPRMHIISNGKLRISPVLLHDRGVYVCTSFDDHGSKIQMESKLIVLGELRY